jgi:hypothetical protein
MWSETKLIGTTTIDLKPARARSVIVASVEGSSHFTGPARLWNESRTSPFQSRRFSTAALVARTSVS